ncbi:MAG: ABC transporter ATP-binding protein [Polyangiaceae bacterium]|nr:ABC transporter ATP-binding protein [Polyangiaceae bacterium]
MTDRVLRASDLAKAYRKPFTRERAFAVRGVSFEVRRGETLGLVGPNGAGKSTTIKMLTGLVRATRGSVEIFGSAAPAPEAMARIGFLPESPTVHPCLTAREFVSMCGRLSGLSGAALTRAVARAFDRVSTADDIDRPARTLSKGMLQRVALAAAIVHDPELLILDEPMSGLDPVGRKEVRDLVAEEKRRGRTVLFSSHILGDVELLCDRVCILHGGEVVASGRLDDLLSSGKRRREITLSGANESTRRDLESLATAARALGEALVLEVEGDDALRAVIERAFSAGARLERVTDKGKTLEDLFGRLTFTRGRDATTRETGSSERPDDTERSRADRRRK